MRKSGHITSVVLSPEQYIAFHGSNRTLNDLNRFCVEKDHAFVVDTTFELTDGLWLTDSSFEYGALLNSEGKHPSFPGPFMWHFKKNEENYR